MLEATQQQALKEKIGKLLTESETSSLESLEATLAELRQFKLDVFTRIEKGLTPCYLDEITKLDNQTIQLKIRELALRISENTSIKDPVLMCLLNGAIPFFNNLSTALATLKFPHQTDTMGAKSYNGTKSCELFITLEPKLKNELFNRDIILCDDVCDSGQTVLKIKSYLIGLGAKSVTFVSLFNKNLNRKEARDPNANPDLSGFDLDEDAFIVGFGLDYNERFRELSDISVVDIATLPKVLEKELLDLEAPLIAQCKHARLQLQGAFQAASPEVAAQKKPSPTASFFRMSPGSPTPPRLKSPTPPVAEAELSADEKLVALKPDETALAASM